MRLSFYPALTTAILALTIGACQARQDLHLANYTQTGERRNCVDETRVQHTIILDDSTVIFQLKNGRTYANRLPDACEGLTGAPLISYSTANAQGLCREDVIFAQTFCYLGVFHRVEPK